MAYGVSASSTASAKTLQNYAVPAVGLEPVYTNTSVDFGSTDVGPLVLGIKNSGADAVYLPLVAASNIAVVAGPPAERRGDEGERPGHGLRPGAPRLAHRQDAQAQHGVVSRPTSRSR